MSVARQTALTVTLRRSILDDIFMDFDISSRFVRRILEPLLWSSAHRFARLAVRFDQAVANLGFREALRQILPILVHDVCYRGTEHVPDEGPLLIVSNHPGTYDSLAIAAGLPRGDLRIVAAGFRTLRKLPHASRHLIFVDRQVPANIAAVRSVVRHLRSGGAVLIFPRGGLEPDPVVLPGSIEALRTWSPSVQIFLDSVPQARTLVTVASGFVAPPFLRSPLTWLKNRECGSLAITEVTQVITQLLFPSLVRLRPCVSYGMAKGVDELRQHADTLHQSVLAEAGRLMADHIGASAGSGIPRTDRSRGSTQRAGWAARLGNALARR